MNSLLHLHLVTFFIICINILIFYRNVSNNLGSKYFMINYIYHKHKQFSCFIITYPFIIILIYYLFESIFPVGTFFISVLHVYFLYELTSKKNINKKEAYIAWYKKNVKHSFSMHAYDMIKKDFNFLNENIGKIGLYKFEIIFFIALIVETEVMYEVFTIFNKIK